ncbi:hypothetical protein, partial [Staphylococcus aureus]
MYRCTVDGVAIFSQLPCGEDAKEITIPTTNVAQGVAKQSKVVDREVDS